VVRYWDDFTSGGNGSKVLANQDGVAPAGGDNKSGAPAAAGGETAGGNNSSSPAAGGGNATSAAGGGAATSAAPGAAAGDAPKVGAGRIQRFHEEENMEGSQVAEKPRRRMQHAAQRFMDDMEREAEMEEPMQGPE
jgi:hypothetical protein